MRPCQLHEPAELILGQKSAVISAFNLIPATRPICISQYSTAHGNTIERVTPVEESGHHLVVGDVSSNTAIDDFSRCTIEERRVSKNSAQHAMDRGQRDPDVLTDHALRNVGSVRLDYG
ncbi:hypothetical protein W59_08089 [Rhodococcus opacus RKJ300 = JCM 13270]|uniref:Uncharacterized protein n=1 Tax=Rhodococcus opacus RKJ300 = JCM 13270 TaxID=1165867 RepID=I0WVQ6_RHOOP|nr:hypothetical protein W59_08089 [Rhodococcus opacus RKJ300 = JCM 13270]